MKESPKIISEKILTLHPQGKSGKNIDLAKYNFLKDGIISVLTGKELMHSELFKELHRRFETEFTGNLDWYSETVKLDLEARKIIERTSSKPPKYKLK